MVKVIDGRWYIQLPTGTDAEKVEQYKASLLKLIRDADPTLKGYPQRDAAELALCMIDESNTDTEDTKNT